MASGGSSGRPSGLSKSFDFGTDDVLCAYDDIGSQDHSNGRRLDAGKEYRENRTGRALVDVYGQRDEFDSRDVLITVEKCMKMHTENLLRILEGINGRLSQLELQCFNLERSLGDLRADIGRDQSESDQKLKSLDKHLQEVHRSLQILRDKQELAETQRELAKLQLAKEASDGGSASAAAATPPEPPSQPLPLALPQPPPRAPEPPAQVPQPAATPPAGGFPQAPGAGAAFYSPYAPWQGPPQQPGQTPPAQYQPGQAQSVPPYQSGQTPSIPPPYQSGQVQSGPSAYAPGQSQNMPPPYQRGQTQGVPPQHEFYGGGGQLQGPGYSGMSMMRHEAAGKAGGYGGGYYGGGGYGTALPPMSRGHPYAELIDKAVNMGYPRDLVISSVRRMEESGQPIDFNSLLDLLNSRPAPPPSQRGWSG